MAANALFAALALYVPRDKLALKWPNDVLLDGGVAFHRINAFGRGEDQPIASNLTEAGKAQNRRVEIVILPTA